MVQCERSRSPPALSELFKVDGTFRRVDSEKDFIYSAGNSRIHKISNWRNSCVPLLSDIVAVTIYKKYIF